MRRRNIGQHSQHITQNGIATTKIEDYGLNQGGIVTTTLEDYGRNPAIAYPDFALAQQRQTADDWFTFELVQSLPRPIRSRMYLRQNEKQAGDATSQLAA